MTTVLRNKWLLGGLSVLAAVLALCPCALLPGQFLLWALLATVLLIPAAEELRLLPGLAVYAAAAILSLLLPIFYSALLFALLGHYAILRPRVEALESRSLRTGIRITIVVLASTALFQVLHFFYGAELLELTGGADALLLAILLVVGALYFLLVNFILERGAAFYRGHIRPKFCRG